MSAARDQIIATMSALLESQGYHATGLNQIVRESGSPRGSLYHYFPGGKEEMAAEAVRQAGDLVLDRITANLAAHDDPVVAVETFIMNIAHNVEKSGYRAGGPLTTVAIETASSSDVLREVCHSIYTRWQQAFVDHLLAGGFSPARAVRLAALIIATIEGGIILCRTSRSPEPLESVAQEIGVLLRAGR